MSEITTDEEALLDKEHIDGVVGKAIKIEAGEDKFVVTCRVTNLKPVSATRDEVILGVTCCLWKHLFKKLDLSKVKPEEMYFALEIPYEWFHKAPAAVLDISMQPNSEINGIEFKLDETEIEPLSLSMFLPKLVIKEEVEDDE